MTDDKKKKSDSYAPPKGATTEHVVALGDKTLRYRAEADFIVLRDEDEPVAELFYSAYFAESETPEARPIVFLFNGGPGASSAYLHVGAVGPRRVVFGDEGQVPPPPVALTANTETWLAFADLVFVDPVGTGFSRIVPDEKESKSSDGDKPKKRDGKAFFKLSKDLDSLGELMTRFLSKHHRWDSPVFIAGESYGGFRVGKLARRLQEGFGIGLNGAILISPALELGWLLPTDYDVTAFVDSFPTMAAIAHHHGRGSALPKGASLDDVLAAAETFASRDLALLLLRGRGIPDGERAAIVERFSAFTGLSVDAVARAEGRISIESFARELLKDQSCVVGLYDGSVTARDPFPDRSTGEGPDPTLFGLKRLFASGVNAHLRRDLGVQSDRQYRLLSFEIIESWTIDTQKHVFDMTASATDDLRYALALNPSMNVFLTHGLFDLVTPYFTSNRLLDLMKLDDAARARVTLRHFHGGHMFYAWKRSRLEFRDAIARFVALHEKPPS
jgi:carboxypeptidase C (cathepsin A)